MSAIGRWCWAAFVSLSFSAITRAQEAPGDRTESARECPRDAVEVHVIAQFAKYGPLSRDREYFGFIFAHHGEIRSAMVKGRRCWKEQECSIDTSLAVPLIPKGAKVLGEWHTHSREGGSRTLSHDDVHGANSNRHIRCYAAYYSLPNGEIYNWDVRLTNVQDAMASRTLLGNYSAERRLFASRAAPRS